MLLDAVEVDRCDPFEPVQTLGRQYGECRSGVRWVRLAVDHITAPATARAGEDPTYTVSLRNRSDTSCQLAPCPAYEEYLVLLTSAGG
jgi:hypothetical protein